MNAGYSNVVEYPGGIEEWFKNEDEDDLMMIHFLKKIVNII